ncbi:PaaI family thioesterase [Nocardioides dongkuii]|uniref:PaaI family thioesterase n=1 Tax=Nocardioides dongkuii TaxID=2760089 RepID=UPI001878D098|nr:PaaI family thioesterase [Nocardioides dongkuii]
MTGYVQDDITDEELERQRALYGPFTQAVRELVDVTIRTLVDDDEIRRAQAEVEAITARLREHQLDGSYGVRFGKAGRGRPWGNTVVGLRNPAAPPLEVEHDESGRAWSEFHLGAPYEGPPGLVHGGVSAMLLDQMLGEAAGAGGKPGMTGTLTLRYRQGTPLGNLRAEAWIDRAEGVKTFAKGHIIGPEGVTVEAEGVFILPRWAREAIAAQDAEKPTPSYFE